MNFIHRVQAVIVMNGTNGALLFAKYFSGPSTPPASRRLADRRVQQELEKSLFETAQKRLSKDYDIMQVSEHSVLYISREDLLFFVVGDVKENQMVLAMVLRTLLNTLCEFQELQYLDSRQLEDKYELLVLTVDEMIDDGIILEVSYNAVVEAIEEVNVSSTDLPGREVLTKLNKMLQENL